MVSPVRYLRGRVHIDGEMTVYSCGALKPQLLAQLRENPELVNAAVEELTRWIPLGAGSAFARYATEDVELGGVIVRAGEPVVASLSSANRDGDVFDDPRLMLAELRALLPR